MDDPTSADDRLPIIETVVYVFSSFTMAWFFAGLTLQQLLGLLELIAPVTSVGRWFIGAALGAWLVRLIVRWINRPPEL